MKRVLLTTYPSAFLYQGGGEREILLLNDALNAAGVMCDIYGPHSKALSSYDCVIHFSLVPGSEYLVDSIRAVGKKLILWPNLWFASEPPNEQVAALQELVRKFDAIVFKSEAEELHFSRYFGLQNHDVVRIRPPISPKFFQQDISEVFRESYGLGRYAIWPGIIEPQKNQLAAIRAFSETGIDLVISGGVRDAEYLQACKREAERNVKFIPAMPFGSELHLSALAHASLYIELPLDFPGTSAIEAVSMGACALLSKCAWVEETLADYCLQVSPCDIRAIRRSVEYLEGLDFPKRKLNKNILMTDAIENLLQYLN